MKSGYCADGGLNDLNYPIISGAVAESPTSSGVGDSESSTWLSTDRKEPVADQTAAREGGHQQEANATAGKGTQ